MLWQTCTRTGLGICLKLISEAKMDSSKECACLRTKKTDDAIGYSWTITPSRIQYYQQELNMVVLAHDESGNEVRKEKGGEHCLVW